MVGVNDCVVCLGVMQGEFHWHYHDEEDEFFYVVDGRFLIDLEEENRTVELEPKQGFSTEGRGAQDAGPGADGDPHDRGSRSRTPRRRRRLRGGLLTATPEVDAVFFDVFGTLGCWYGVAVRGG